MRPGSFDEDFRNEWDLWALDHGLPVPPSVLTTLQSVPVARWAGAEFGAVMHVAWMCGMHDVDADDEDHLISDVQVYRRVGSAWEASSGSGGTSWFDPPFVRPTGVGPKEAWIGGVHASGGADWRCCAVDGMAGSDAAYLEVDDGSGTSVRPIESPFGVFIACFDAEAVGRLRVLDRDGQPMLDRPLPSGA